MKRYFFLFGMLAGGLLLWSQWYVPASETIIPERTPAATVMPIREEETRESTRRKDENIKNVPIETKSVFEDSSIQQDDTVLVTRVVDGDTIEIEGGEKVRYIGMNTPESVDPRRAVQCFGKEASAYNKKLVLGKRVRLEPDVEDRDKYHRLLRYVWLGDTMINEQLVTDGYAQTMTITPNVKYVDLFKQAQTEAREEQRGLWAKCKK
ncbi:thermonuclease family protein [Candidatus Uhrbacteria bacterium]|nr:thermonuclease family protein [Candidatus Uhrbacteria bacterium]